MGIIMSEETLMFLKAIGNGWMIIPCSCECGGRFAWLTPNDELYGCICHNKMTDETLFEKKGK